MNIRVSLSSGIESMFQAREQQNGETNEHKF